MGQHKMEKDFRNKLNQREIAPSAHAWDRIDAMLTVAEQKKPKKDYGWLYIAASILVFLFIGLMYFNNIPELKDVRKNDNGIVFQNNEKENIQSTSEKILPTVKDYQSVATLIPKKNSKSANITNSIINQKTTINQTSDNALALQSSNPVNNFKKETLIAANKIINQDLDLSKNEQTVNKAKVDELLANVGAIPPSENAKSTVKVNAKNLLSQIDGEVNQTFREKMIHKLGRNYQEVAEAVSNRNIQQ